MRKTNIARGVGLRAMYYQKVRGAQCHLTVLTTVCLPSAVVSTMMTAPL